MKTTHMAVLSVMVLAAAVLGGCNKGIEVTFVNNTPNPIVVDYHTQGLAGDPEDLKDLYELGDIDPGAKKTAYLKYDEEDIKSDRQLSINVDPATLKATNALVPIRRAPYTPKKLNVSIGSGPDVKYDITVTDENGKKIDTK